ncbi:hypothetical protein ON010_g16474 [Phytophthora cinnamomi]|nr:hypothetical protein ON010_g16474 [Phytophthora cinnamomi]
MPNAALEAAAELLVGSQPPAKRKPSAFKCFAVIETLDERSSLRSPAADARTLSHSRTRRTARNDGRRRRRDHDRGVDAVPGHRHAAAVRHLLRGVAHGVPAQPAPAGHGGAAALG